MYWFPFVYARETFGFGTKHTFVSLKWTWSMKNLKL